MPIDTWVKWPLGKMKQLLMLGLIMSVVWPRVPLGEDHESIATLDADRTNGWALHQACYVIDHCLGTQGDVIGCGLVRPSRGCRIYCYSGYPRKCRKWAWPGATTQLPLEVSKDMLRMGVAWCDQIFQILGVTRQTAGCITAQEGGGARGNAMNGCGLVRRVLVKAIKRVGKTSFFR